LRRHLGELGTAPWPTVLVNTCLINPANGGKAIPGLN
jgi:hypothetical protein